MKDNIYYSKKYNELGTFITVFDMIANPEDYGDEDGLPNIEMDIKAINHYINMLSAGCLRVGRLEQAKENIKEVIPQAREVLNLPLEEFPWKWVAMTMYDRWIAEEFLENGKSDAEQCQNWLSWAIDTYESEARKRGLLD